MRVLRWSMGLVVLLLAGWLGRALLAPKAASSAPMTFTSSSQCRDCHPKVYVEWQASWHSKAWIDEDVRALSMNFANKDCIDCHAPRPVFETGIGERVLPRSSRRSEGVDCIACHALPEAEGGGMAGTMEDPRAACRPVVRRELASETFCAGCHDQHQTVQQWKETPYAQQGVSCVDCHMPYRGGDPNAGRDHTSLAAHDPEMVRSAVELTGTRSDEGWEVAVENVAAGHHFPTDERSRAADLFWRPIEEDASEDGGPWRHLYRFRSPYRHEVDLPETLLPHGERRVLPLQHPEARGAVEVALFYKLSPYYLDPESGEPMPTEEVGAPEAQALLVHRLRLEP